MDTAAQLPVVNRGRLKRLAPEPPALEWNLNNVCVAVIVLCCFFLWKLAIDVTHRRDRLDTLLLWRVLCMSLELRTFVVWTLVWRSSPRMSREWGASTYRTSSPRLSIRYTCPNLSRRITGESKSSHSSKYVDRSHRGGRKLPRSRTFPVRLSSLWPLTFREYSWAETRSVNHPRRSWYKFVFLVCSQSVPRSIWANCSRVA